VASARIWRKNPENLNAGERTLLIVKFVAVFQKLNEQLDGIGLIWK
jgi:hypothetical protein